VVRTQEPPPIGNARALLRLRAHIAALALVLIGVGLVVGPGLFSGDEGAALAQAKVLAESGHWGIVERLPLADRDGSRAAVDKSDRLADGTDAPLTKHPLYPWVLAQLSSRISGGVARWAQVLSILGTLGAAIGAAGLATRMRWGDPRVVLWAAGVGSPLLFDSTLAIAHTLAAAAIAVVALAAVELWGGAAVHWRWWAVLTGGTMFAVALRHEAVVAVGVAAVVLMLAGWQTRRSRPLLLGITIGAVGAASWIADRAVTKRVTGVVGSVALPAQGSSGLRARADGAVTTLLQPGYGARPWAGLAFAAAGVVLVVAWRSAGSARRVLSVVAGVMAAASLVLPGVSAIPGLLVACPALVIGLVLAASDRSTRWVWSGVIVFGVGILAIQYAEGGGAEWGWRYVALALPIAVPLAVHGFRGDGRRSFGDPAVLAVAAVSLCGALFGVRAAYIHRHRTEARVEAVARLAATPAAAPGDGGAPVVVSPLFSLGRFSWDQLDTQRQLRIAPGDLGAVSHDLDRSGVRAFTFVGLENHDPVPDPVGWSVTGDQHQEGMRLVVYRHR
jgi:hypothetical protein